MATSMSMWSAALSAHIVFLILPTVSAKPVHFAEGTQEFVDVKRLLKSIDKLLHYYIADIRKLNLDGFYGVRVLEGHMMVMVQEYESGKHQHVPESVWQNISRLAKIANAVGEKGMDFVRKDNPNYFDDFRSIITRPWSFFKTQRRLDPNLRWEIPQYKAKVKNRFSEKLSDQCMKEVMNSSPSNCSVSELCLNTMTNRGLTGYGITHQLIWSIFVELSNDCKLPIEAALKSQGMDTVASMQLEMCTNNFYEMIAVVHVLMKGKIHESHQDLFLEQQFVCPSLGFYEFVKKDYLDQILSWQYPSGCFGDKDEEETDNENHVDVESLLETYHEKHEEKNQTIGKMDNVQMMQHRGIKSIGVSNSINNDRKPLHPESILLENHNTMNSVLNVGRKLLVEKRLTGDCLSHKTGVAAGALMVYLRYLIEPGDIMWKGPHELFEIDRKKMIQSNEKPKEYLNEEDVNNDDDDDDNNENIDKQSVGREVDNEEADKIQSKDFEEDQPVYDENVEDKLKEQNLIQPSRSSFIQQKKIQMDAFAKRNQIRSDSDINGDVFPNVLYGNVEEGNFKSSHPSALLFFLVSLCPMVMIVFFLFKIIRRYRVLRLCFNF